jgi:hypothetical protein
MWPFTLSGRLPIFGLVGRYLTNYLIGREPISHRIAPLTPVPSAPWSHAVLVQLSLRYPPVKGRLLTRYSPVRRWGTPDCSFVPPLDLHVLGTPPAFVLSQDQTLVFNPSGFLHPKVASPG